MNNNTLSLICEQQKKLRSLRQSATSLACGRVEIPEGKQLAGKLQNGSGVN